METNNNTKAAFYVQSSELTFKAKADGSSKRYIISGDISTDDEDLVSDIVTQKCMDDIFTQLENRTIKLDYEHETFIGDSAFSTEKAKTKSPLGKRVMWERKPNSVHVEWELNPDWQIRDKNGSVVKDFKAVWREIKNGFLDAFSIAYVPLQSSNTPKEGRTIRLLDKVNLLNVALTGTPVNPAARMSAVMAKSLEYMERKNMENEQKEKDSKMNSIKKPSPEEKDEQEEDKVKTEKKSEETPKEPDAQATPAEESTEESTASEAPVGAEVKSMQNQLIEIKAQLKVFDALHKQVEELKSVVESARNSTIGAADAAELQNRAEVKAQPTSIGPLDYI